MGKDADGTLLHAAIYERDAPAAAAKYRPDAVLVSPIGRFEGQEAIARHFRWWFDPFSEPEVDEWLRTGDAELQQRLVIASTFSATHTGDLTLPDGGMWPATGRRISVRAMEVVVLDDDDMIVEHLFYYDLIELLTQVGLTAAWSPAG